VSSLLVALFTFTTWLEIHEGGKQTDRIIAADSSMASAQQHSLALTAAAVRIADAALRSSERAFLVGQRPYLEADFGTWPADVQWVTADVKPLDIGKTPALVVMVRDSIVMLEPETPAADSVLDRTFEVLRRSRSKISGDLAPNQSTISHSTVLHLIGEEREGYHTGNLALFYIGVITYRDYWAIEITGPNSVATTSRRRGPSRPRCAAPTIRSGDSGFVASISSAPWGSRRRAVRPVSETAPRGRRQHATRHTSHAARQRFLRRNRTLSQNGTNPRDRR
jgi:hypothetical protein